MANFSESIDVKGLDNSQPPSPAPYATLKERFERLSTGEFNMHAFTAERHKILTDKSACLNNLAERISWS